MLIQQENTTLRNEMAGQMTHFQTQVTGEMGLKLDPLANQVDHLISRVEFLETIDTEEFAMEDTEHIGSDVETEVNAAVDQDGYAPVKPNRSKRSTAASAAGILHGGKVLKKNGLG